MNPPPQPCQRLTAAATAAGTLAVTLALLAGMPYILWQATGLPWPGHVSSLSDFGQRLTQPISDPLVIDLLAMVGWVCWAAFACTVVRETAWYTTHLPQLLRDRHAHHEHVAALSMKGSLAALCIGTLVVALLTLWRPQPVSAQQPTFPGEAVAHTAATALVIPASAQQPAPATATPAATAQAAARPAPPYSRPPGQTDPARHMEYTVVEGDTLWDLARTHLGDAVKWPRIYALNKDRPQCDGARLTDPDLILPGWHLTIPVDRPATPPPTRSPAPPDAAPDSTPPEPAETAPPPTPDRHTDAEEQGEGERTSPETGQEKGTKAPKAAPPPGPAAISLGEASLIGITAAAGLLAARRYWYWHQHRRRPPGRETDIPALSPLVDKAAQAAHAATRPRLSSADTQPLAPRQTPPQRPHAKDTVTIGIRQDTEVPLDELATPGGCTWTGPGAHNAARALLVGILTAAERQRPGPSRVTAVTSHDVAENLLPGLPTRFSALTQSTDPADAIRTAEQHLITHARTRDDQPTAPGETGPASADAAPEHGPGTLLLLTTPHSAHTGQLQALATRATPETLIVVTLDTPLPGATSWHIADDGTVTTEAPGQHVGSLRLFQLTPDAGRDVTEVLLTARGERPRLRILSTTQRPEAAHPDASPAPPAPDPPTFPQAVDTTRPKQTKPVRLHVFGPVTLYARSHPDPVGTNMRSEVHEFLALLAAHPTGLLASDIADKLHLAPGQDQNALKNLRRAVRRALRSATGITGQEFILLQGDIHKLHPELVETDLADFNHSLQEAFATSGKKEEWGEELAAVRDALAHYRGPFAHGSDYLWADAIREHCAMKATDAALRLTRQAEHSSATSRERDTVLELLEHLGTLHPDHERLAQHTIRLYQSAGRHDAARHTYTRLERHLAELGLEPEPATQALVTPRPRSRQTR
ncbi:BTAD domain-containing putative transcriptional regulator [Streptomyces sp. NPDC057877]|uniref:BTAD domain-containing putative transcriptional regulator n=1 Tax=Streptomyces sp. NPDC057877 TaxID=3346269 RepID=UPI0036BB44E1